MKSKMLLKQTKSTAQERFLFLSVIVLTLLTVILFFLRFSNAISFDKPLQLSTSGGEHQTIYEIWRYLYGKPIYGDQFTLPFAAAEYNWFFYYFYGSAIKLISNAFSLTDAWIPTVGRVITICIASIGSIFIFLISRKLFSLSRPFTHALLILFSVFLMFGPLIGFWAMAVRPDVLSFVLEIIGFYLFFRYIETKNILLFFGAIFCCYLAWATKHYNIFLISGITMSLLLCKQWRLGGLAAGFYLFFLLITFVVGTDDYFHSLLDNRATPDIDYRAGLSNWLKYSSKTSVFVLPGAACLAYLAYRWRTFSTPIGIDSNDSVMTLIILVSGIVSLCIASAFVFQVFASHNYFFSNSMYMYFACLLIFERIYHNADKAISWCFPLMSTSSLINAAIVLLYLTGTIGALSPKHRLSEVEVEAAIRCFKALPKPIMTADSLYKLPWISGNVYPFHFIVNYHYRGATQKELENRYEYGGIDGMLDSGLIATVVSYPGEVFKHKDYKKVSSTPKACQGVGQISVLNTFVKDLRWGG